MSTSTRNPARLAYLRAMATANGHNPDALPVRLSRPPTASEIRFGHGCRHYRDGTAPVGRRFVTIDGQRWTVEGGARL